MSTTLPSLSKTPNLQETQAYLNAAALYFQQESQEAMKKELDQKGDVFSSTAVITDDLIASLLQKTSTEALEHLGKHFMSHPEAIVTASTAAVGAPPNFVAVGVLGLMMLVMSSTASSSIGTTASQKLEEFIKTNSSFAEGKLSNE